MRKLDTGGREGGYTHSFTVRTSRHPHMGKFLRRGSVVLTVIVVAGTGLMGATHPREAAIIATAPLPNPGVILDQADSGQPQQDVQPLPTNTTAPPPLAPGKVSIPSNHSIALSPAQVQAVMIEAGWPRDQIATGVAVATNESGRIPNRLGTSTRIGVDRGLFQINSYYWATDLKAIDWADPVQNARLALKIWRSGGWHAWHAYRPWMANATLPDPGSYRGAQEK